MLSNKVLFLVNFAYSFILSVIFTYICIKTARYFNMVDIPNERKIHKHPVPYLGGVGIYFAFIISLLISLKLSVDMNVYTKGISGLLIASFIIFLLGLYDDLKGADAKLKFAIQIIAALVLVKSGYLVDRISNPLGGIIYFPYWLSIIVTIFWIVGIINAVNLLDGLDGLASGVMGISSLFIFIIAYIQNNYIVAYITIILVGVNMGFLLFNKYPAKIFMGDTGSMFLGLMFAIIAILGNRKSAVAINLLIPIVLLTIPIIDTILAIVRRVNQKRNIFRADKEHIHHRLLNLGIPYKKVILLIYLFCIYLGMISLLSLYLPNEFIFIILLIVSINIFIGLYVLKLVESHVKKDRL